jgi:hypothetical protein
MAGRVMLTSAAVLMVGCVLIHLSKQNHNTTTN